MAKRFNYSEPAEYIPKSIRKQFQVGEFAPKKKEAATATKKTVKKSTATKKK